jgi:hypothetical protein
MDSMKGQRAAPDLISEHFPGHLNTVARPYSVLLIGRKGLKHFKNGICYI